MRTVLSIKAFSWNLIWQLIVFITLSSCAIQGGAPQGGEKDVTPPKAISQSPPNKTTHFDAVKIQLNFDENIEIANASTEVLFTPQTEGFPSYHAKGRSIIVSLKTVKLSPNTTYTIMFGNSIRDVHEGNILPGLNYVFSTGDYVDSLTMKGSAINALNGKSEGGYLALLYKPGDDSAVYKTKPLYFVKGDSSGHFDLQNLPKDSFKLYVLKDKNGNLIIDEGEEAGMYPGIVVLDSATQLTKPIMLYTEPKRRLVILKIKATQQLMQVTFNRAVDSISFGKLKGFTKYSDKKDSASFWPIEPLVEGSTIAVTGYVNALKDDSVLKVRKLEETKSAVKLSFIAPAIAVNNLGALFVIESPLPVIKLDTSKISITTSDKKVKGLKITFADSAHTKVGLYFPLVEDSNYSLKLLPGGFQLVGNVKHDTLSTGIRAPKRDDYALLQVKVELPDSGRQWIVQLIKGNEEVIAERFLLKSGIINWPYLPTGSFRLRAILDINRNGRFDGGNSITGREPEKVIYYKSPLELKPNWEVSDLLFHVE